MSIEYGVSMTCYGDLLAEIDRQDEIFRTCKLCGFVASTADRKFKHMKSENCRERVAKKLGIPYVSEQVMPKYCKSCKCNVQTKHWKRHCKSVKHNLSDPDLSLYFCKVCNKDFNRKSRPKRAYERHLKNKVHLRKCSCVASVITTGGGTLGLIQDTHRHEDGSDNDQPHHEPLCNNHVYAIA